MNKRYAFAYGLLIAGGVAVPVYAADQAEQPKPAFQFEAAQPGEDLSRFRNILERAYGKLVQEGKEEALHTSIDTNFPKVCNWVGQKGKRFIKVHQGEEAVGFFTFEALDDAETKVAIHMSPVLKREAYQHVIPQIKAQFPHATKVSTAASEELVHMHAIIKAFGFKEDPEYKVTKELSLDHLGKMIGYSRDI